MRGGGWRSRKGLEMREMASPGGFSQSCSGLSVADFLPSWDMVGLKYLLGLYMIPHLGRLSLFEAIQM
jgi:hypothetical protein